MEEGNSNGGCGCVDCRRPMRAAAAAAGATAMAALQRCETADLKKAARWQRRATCAGSKQIAAATAATAAQGMEDGGCNLGLQMAAAVEGGRGNGDDDDGKGDGCLDGGSDFDVLVDGSDIVALARGSTVDKSCLKQEGERMKKWAESMWRSRRLSLAEALEFSEPSKSAVVDTRICRVL
ncbi:hypothetical protein B296_00025092 [Ensete ventricosum]|uniref:Uncharacterized protein n=1 Tax=Ensete ventricosum TaxID=4639 RepID=A0A426YM44_ENSVE|nr:hypothetical protein B296_00025092 [Ensete ventricosum]